MDFHTTQPQGADPFAETLDDPREVQRLVREAMQKATRRRAAGPAPKLYWEEPGHHGSGRQVSLRAKGRLPASVIDATRARVRKQLGLPPLPRRGLSGGTVALIGLGAVGAAVLVGVLVNRARQRRLAGAVPRSAVPQVGSGFDLLGCEP